MNANYRNIGLAISMSLALITCSACGNQPDADPGPAEDPVPNPAPNSSQESAPSPASNTSPAPEITEMVPESKPPAVNHQAVLQEQIAHAQADLATRLDLDPSAVSIVSSGPVTWRSGALGCPKPGMMYTQALVPGFQVILQAGKTTYHYHAKAGGQPFYCPQDRVESSARNNRVYE